jgi:hypothetical protein
MSAQRSSSATGATALLVVAKGTCRSPVNRRALAHCRKARTASRVVVPVASQRSRSSWRSSTRGTPCSSSHESRARAWRTWLRARRLAFSVSRPVVALDRRRRNASQVAKTRTSLAWSSGAVVRISSSQGSSRAKWVCRGVRTPAATCRSRRKSRGLVCGSRSSASWLTASSPAAMAARIPGPVLVRSQLSVERGSVTSTSARCSGRKTGLMVPSGPVSRAVTCWSSRQRGHRPSR